MLLIGITGIMRRLSIQRMTSFCGVTGAGSANGFIRESRMFSVVSPDSPLPPRDTAPMTDLIKIAKAMNLEIYSRGGDTYPLRKLHNNLMQPFDPFTDANDDYAVLEWAIKNLDAEKYQMALLEVCGSYAYLWEYRVGYFATAALKVPAIVLRQQEPK